MLTSTLFSTWKKAALLIGLLTAACTTAVAQTDWTNLFDSSETRAALNRNRPVLQQSNSEAQDVKTSDGITVRYMPRRRALTGEGCDVNHVINTVSVATAYTELENLCDEDLNNSASFAKGVGVDVGEDPIVGVRDKNHYYAKGTRAGFVIEGANGTSVLQLNVIKMATIGFYRDGKRIGTKVCDEGQTGTGIGLSLIQIPGSGESVVSISAIAPDVFDEVTIEQAGVDLSVVDHTRVKYAFVGNPSEIILNHDWTTGVINKTTHTGDITRYNNQFGRHLELIEAKVNGINAMNNDFAEDPTKSQALIVPLVQLGNCSALVRVRDNDRPNEETFPQVTQISFKLEGGGVLDLSIGMTTQIHFLDKNGDEISNGTVLLESGVLDLGVASGGVRYVSATSPVPFSGAKLTINGVSVNLSATNIYYASIVEMPEQDHRCNLATQQSVYLGPEQDEVLLQVNRELDVEWSLISQPEGGNATVSTYDGRGLLSGCLTRGQYVVRAQVRGHQDCYEDIIVRNDQFLGEDNTLAAGGCGTPLANTVDENLYTVSTQTYGITGSLLSISDTSSEDNLIDSDLENYVEYQPGLSLADNMKVTGVKRIDGQPIHDGSKAVRVGFVVEHSTQGLNLSTLQFMRIRLFNKGADGKDAVYEAPIEESNAISADLLSENFIQRVRYSIVVPEGKVFDEIQLWKSGVLNLEIGEVRVYYPFIEEDTNSACSSVLGCDGELVNMHATVTMELGGGANVGQTVNNLQYLIDDDLESYMSMTNGVSGGAGLNILVDMGKTVGTDRQVGIITDNKTMLAGVTAGEWLKIRTRTVSTSSSSQNRAQGVATGEEWTNWSVVSADVAGFGDKSVIYITPGVPFSQMEIEVAKIVSLLNVEQKYYGICTRGDVDHDGVPDCMDTAFTPEEDLLTDPYEDIPTPANWEEEGNTTGLDAININPVIGIDGDRATVNMAGLERVLVYDLKGNVVDAEVSVDGKSLNITLPEGISILTLEMRDMRRMSYKVAR